MGFDDWRPLGNRESDWPEIIARVPDPTLTTRAGLTWLISTLAAEKESKTKTTLRGASSARFRTLLLIVRYSTEWQ